MGFCFGMHFTANFRYISSGETNDGDKIIILCYCLFMTLLLLVCLFVCLFVSLLFILHYSVCKNKFGPLTTVLLNFMIIKVKLFTKNVTGLSCLTRRFIVHAVGLNVEMSRRVVVEMTWMF